MAHQSSIIQSAEVRWFWREPQSHEAQRWFESVVQSLPLPEIRDDLYHQCTSRGSGIKLRPNPYGLLFEFKFRKTRVLRRESTWSGYVETWEKWSLPVMQHEVATDESWIRISKSRQLARFAISGKPAFANANERLVEGCTFEFTKLSLQGNAWSTIGFESFSQSGQEQNNLNQAIGFVFACDPNHAMMNEENSLSYPEWFSMTQRL